jgi:hypothetical protein
VDEGRPEWTGEEDPPIHVQVAPKRPQSLRRPSSQHLHSSRAFRSQAAAAPVFLLLCLRCAGLRPLHRRATLFSAIMLGALSKNRPLLASLLVSSVFLFLSPSQMRFFAFPVRGVSQLSFGSRFPRRLAISRYENQ